MGRVFICSTHADSTIYITILYDYDNCIGDLCWLKFNQVMYAHNI